MKTEPDEYTPADPGLSVEQVAAELGITRSTARRMILDHQIPHFIARSGRRKSIYRVRRSVLMRWIETQERHSVKYRSDKNAKPE